MGGHSYKGGGFKCDLAFGSIRSGACLRAIRRRAQYNRRLVMSIVATKWAFDAPTLSLTAEGSDN